MAGRRGGAGRTVKVEEFSAGDRPEEAETGPQRPISALAPTWEGNP
jgi:hypothetical protein